MADDNQTTLSEVELRRLMNDGLRQKITRTVRKQQKALDYRDTTLGAVAGALRMSLDDTFAAIEAMHGYWVCCKQVSGVAMTEWPVFEDGE